MVNKRDKFFKSRILKIIIKAVFVEHIYDLKCLNKKLAHIINNSNSCALVGTPTSSNI